MLPTPTADYVRSRLLHYEGHADYAAADKAVEIVFRTWPANENLPEVLIKVVTLNRLYSTNVFNVHSVAGHIVDLAIDDALQSADADLVNRIARVRLKDNRSINYYSFATKYCAWHKPDDYQIYDSRVEKAIQHYMKHYQFSKYSGNVLRDYSRFVQVVEQFTAHFELFDISRRQLDKFLWLEGGDPAAAL